jgi:hypothetical protein
MQTEKEIRKVLRRLHHLLSQTDNDVTAERYLTIISTLEWALLTTPIEEEEELIG